jgi:putative thioredoxin
MGALPEAQVSAFIERLLGKSGGADDDLLKTAEAALAGGQPAEAAELFAQVLAEEPENVRALGGLAKAHLDAGNPAAARATIDLVGKDKQNDPAVKAVRAALELAEQAASVGDTAALEAKLAANPQDFQAHFDLAIALNAAGKREQALDHLLEIVRRNRTWNEEAARKQLVQFFEAWGPADEMTMQGRRRLSSILFS